MNKRTWDAMLIGGSTLAGGVLGNWAGARATLAFGCNFGPWGAVTGAIMGALIGAMLSGGPRATGESDFDTV